MATRTVATHRISRINPFIALRTMHHAMISRMKKSTTEKCIDSPEVMPSENSQCFAIFRTGRLNDVGRQFRRRRLLVPADALEVIADKLLIEGRLRFSWRILIGRPETGGIRRQHLIDNGDITVDRAEFEFRVAKNDAS